MPSCAAALSVGYTREHLGWVCSLFVLGHPGYYTRCGFVSAFPFGLRAPYPIVPEEAWMVRPLVPDVLVTVTGVIACPESMAKPEYWRE